MIRLYIAVTDNAWFRQLSAIDGIDEVNFWQPSGRTQFRALQPGELFLFKLHSPDNYIAGGGVFSHSSIVPLSMAWDAFGVKNGVQSITEMRKRLAHYRREPSLVDERTDPAIGCRILTQPFFWPREKWIPVPASFSPNIVAGKGYSTDEADGRALWDAVTDRWASTQTLTQGKPSTVRFGAPQLIRPRLGQGAFRVSVTDSYERRCAVTGERTLPILDAAHIKSYAAGGEHVSSNGLLLRTDIHRLFDLGYVTVDPDRRFVVSRRLKEDFDNGKHYYGLEGSLIRSPLDRSAIPSPDALAWHREYRFRG
jgi:putative restriction endonuclease